MRELHYLGINRQRENEAAIIIQKYIRGYFVRIYRNVFKMRKEKYIELKQKITKIQNFFIRSRSRSICTSRLILSPTLSPTFRPIKKQTVLLIFIKQILKERKKAALIIERYYISYKEKKKTYLQLLCNYILKIRNEAAIIIQKYLKGYYTRKIVNKIKKSFVIQWRYEKPKYKIEVIVKIIINEFLFLKKYMMKYCFIQNCYAVSIMKINGGLYEYYFHIDDKMELIDPHKPVKINTSGKKVNYAIVYS